MMKGYDKTSLNKFRLPHNYVTNRHVELKKNDIREYFSLREYLNDENEILIFRTALENPDAAVFFQKESGGRDDEAEEGLSIMGERISEIISNLASVQIYNSIDAVRPDLLTAKSEQMHVYSFSFSFEQLIQELGIPKDLVQELFLINSINSIIQAFFQNSAYTVKDGDRIILFILTISKQDRELLGHQLNRTISSNLFGATKERISLLSPAENIEI